jgi:hypothetical protein
VKRLSIVQTVWAGSLCVSQLIGYLTLHHELFYLFTTGLFAVHLVSAASTFRHVRSAWVACLVITIIIMMPATILLALFVPLYLSGHRDFGPVPFSASAIIVVFCLLVPGWSMWQFWSRRHQLFAKGNPEPRAAT